MSNLTADEDVEKLSTAIKLNKKYIILQKQGQVWILLSTSARSRDALQGYITGLLMMEPSWSKVAPVTLLDKLKDAGWSTDRLAIQTEGFLYSTFSES